MSILTLDLALQPNVPQDADFLQSQLKQIVKITDETSFVEVSEIARTAGEREKAIASFFDGTKDKPGPTALAFQAHRSLTGLRDKFLKPFSDIRDAATKSMKAFRDEQRRIEQQKAFEAERVARAERERLEREAREARKRGEMEAAREIVAQAEMVVAEVPAPITPKVQGVQERKTFKAEVMEPLELIKAIADGRVDLMQPRSSGPAEPLLRVNETLLRDMARRLGKDFKLPGVSVYEDVGIVVGRR